MNALLRITDRIALIGVRGVYRAYNGIYYPYLYCYCNLVSSGTVYKRALYIGADPRLVTSADPTGK